VKIWTKNPYVLAKEEGGFPPLDFFFGLWIRKYVGASFKKAQRFVYVRFPLPSLVFLYRSEQTAKGAMKLRLCFVVAV